MLNKRLTWKRSVDGYTDVGLRKGVTVYEAICKLADYEEAEAEAKADAVEVVRCKDCKDSFYRANGTYYCSRTGKYVFSCDFCSYGERRADG